jgi:glycosyltransferase involved in cell wall biosynthesis
VDAKDKAEAKKTRFVLKVGIRDIVHCITMLLKQPRAVISVILQALAMGRRSDRGIIRHLAYVIEAAILANWCRNDQVQHIHAHFGTNSTAIAMFASQLSGIRFSFTAHGPEEFERGTSLSLDAKLRNAAFAVCISFFGKSQLMRLSEPDQWEKIAIVHCGVDSSFITAAAGELPSTARFVCIGRLSQEKGHLVLISAAQKLREAGTECEIVFAGDGPMRKAIEEAIGRAGLQANITITGWITGERVKIEVEAARALVLPSFAEGLPVVIMEAMALNRPVISTYVAGIPEIVQTGKTGWLVAAGDAVALAQAIQEAIVAPKAQLAAIGEAGRRYVLDQHDVVKEAKKLKTLIERSIFEA